MAMFSEEEATERLKALQARVAPTYRSESKSEATIYELQQLKRHYCALIAVDGIDDLKLACLRQHATRLLEIVEILMRNEASK